MAIETDATPVEAPKDPYNCNLYKIMQLFAPPARMQEIHDLYINGGAAYGYLKLQLLDLLTRIWKAEKENSDICLTRRCCENSWQRCRKSQGKSRCNS